MNYRDFTKVFIFVTLGIIILVDLFLWIWGEDSTISSVIVDYTYKWPVISFIAGVVCGHLFWPMTKSGKLDGK